MTDALEADIGYHFKDRRLLLTALTHSSYANEHGAQGDNERLEFLGDAVLELCASHYLYESFPDEPEGILSRHRSGIVCEPSLAACARRLKLGEALRLGKGEEKNGGRGKDSLLSDAFEALIGAIYLDGGFEEANAFIIRNVMSELAGLPVFTDAKTKLQELLQTDGERHIVYSQLSEEGPGHERIFTFEVAADGIPLGQGSGRSKKLAEQAAARDALNRLSAGRV